MKKKLFVLLLLLFCKGCTSIGYYHQSISGHLSLISKRETITDILKDSSRDENLLSQLRLSQELRDFASQELYLPDNDSYRSYVDVQKPYITWNIFAAQEFSIHLQQWCFVVVGCVQYRGYYDELEANTYAAELQEQGLETYVAGVPAYSTLGWFDDPLLSTMLDRGEVVTASYIFHELAHQLFYVKDDTAFNEAFATAVEELGVEKWFEQQSRIQELNNYKKWLTQKSIFSDFIKTARNEFKQLYSTELPEAEMRSAREQKVLELREQFAELSTSNKQISRYAKWMSGPLNNAQLGAISLYRDQVPYFRRIFDLCRQEFNRFYAYVETISKLPQEERTQILQSTNECNT